MARLRAVTFDVWQTLMTDQAVAAPHPRTELRISRMGAVLRDAGIALDEAALRSAYDALGEFCTREWEQREVGHDEQLRWLCTQASAGRPFDLSAEAWEALEAAYVDPIYDDPPSLAPNAAYAVGEARRLGLRVGLICNTGYTPGYALRKLFTEWALLDLFDDLAFSNEEALRKPSPELFARVAARLGAEPSEIAHVGDDVRTDVAGSKAAGFRAVLIHSRRPESIPVEPDAFITDLAELPPVLARWLQDG